MPQVDIKLILKYGFCGYHISWAYAVMLKIFDKS